MSDSQTFGFAKLVPGFDFLQNLAKGAGGGLPQMTQLSSWIAPTLSVEELDKRIQELRAVHFWLEQNGKALSATIQALEVQKMTLSTLQGMNLSMNELAESLQVKPGAMASAFASPAPAPAPGPSSGPSAADAPPAASSPRKATQPSGSAKTAGKSAKAAQGAAGAGTAAVDPLQWWGALSNQFQQIATATLKDVAQAGAQAAPASAAAPGAAGTSGRRPAPAAKSKATKASKVAKSTTGTRAPRSPAKPRSRAAPSA